MEPREPVSRARYTAALEAYQASPSSGSRHAARIGRALVPMGLGPTEIVVLHAEVVGALAQELTEQEKLRLFSLGHHFLLEVMLAYGDQYRAFMTKELADAATEASALLQAEAQHGRDVTQQLAEAAEEADALLQAEQQHSRDLIQLGIDKDEAFAMVAHELRTPLTAAKAMLELSQAALNQGRTEQVPDLLTRLQSAIDTLTHLTNDLTEVTRNEAVALELGPVDICAAVEQACSWIIPAANAKEIKIIQPTDGRLLVHGNVEALVSMISNLLSNAVRYSPSGTVVTVRLGTAEGMAVVEVQDTGIGMRPEELSHIFERFYRAPEAKRDVPRGLGIGLAIVKQLTEAHRGEITAESELGQGSTFRISLPLSSSATQASSS